MLCSALGDNKLIKCCEFCKFQKPAEVTMFSINVIFEQKKEEQFSAFIDPISAEEHRSQVRPKISAWQLPGQILDGTVLYLA